MNVPRRSLLAGALGVAGLAGCQASGTFVPARAITHTGGTQAGIDRPAPQPHADLGVFDVTGRPGQVLGGLGDLVLALTSGSHPRLAGLPPGDLTVTVGAGPRLVSAVDPELPGAVDLPVFEREAITHPCRGGDLMVQVRGTDQLAVSLASAALSTVDGVQLRWRQRGFHAERNLLGFLDGTENPRGPEELASEVWLAGPGRVAGGTIAVIRRLRLDLAGFAALPVTRQEEIIGRRRADGEPLSGGGTVSLAAKSADGEYLIPPTAHVRRAHRLATGSGMMLRQGYSYDNGWDDRGLLFISYQRDLRTFTATQHRMDEGDDLMAFTTCTASGTFLVLPGFGPGAPLGGTLF
ncbi:Dyp-type peroxidase [Longispora albida]|uniref:Dyp-type peroxidase n=1 Tax=Longispora albida TaxID=203523 RepID=UPI00037DB20B|nr:Dyp-type peroxidase [Longispora albida]